MRTHKIALSGLLIGLALGGLALTGAGCAGDRYHRSTGAYVDDKGINTRVKTALFRDPQVSGFDVHVNSFRGDVQLSGFVDTQEQKDRAAQVASEVSGVRLVTNNLEIKTGTSAVGSPAPGVSASSGTITQPMPEPAPANRPAGTPAPMVTPQINPSTQNSQLDQSNLSPSLSNPNSINMSSSPNNPNPNNLDQAPASPNAANSSALPSNPAPLDTRMVPSFQISAANGHATLRGTVASDAQKQDIERRVREIPGIQSIDNQIDVQSPR